MHHHDLTAINIVLVFVLKVNETIAYSNILQLSLDIRISIVNCNDEHIGTD